MKNKYLYALSAAFYIVFFSCFICLIFSDVLFLNVSNTVKIITTFILFLSEILGTHFLCVKVKNEESRKKIKSTSAFILFFAYTVILIDFTLIDGSFGRSISNFFALTSAEKSEYLSLNTNFIPFATIRLFINGFIADKVSFLNILINLLGNMIVFCPFAYFIPTFFKRINTVFKFFITITSIVIVIEVLQLIFITGSMDIDDLILNIPPAVITFIVLKYKKYLD